MKIIITGSAGFIGYHLCKSLLNDNHEILGIDNINSYYDTRLKITRNNFLLENKNFKFKKIDIINKADLSKAFKSFMPDIVVNDILTHMSMTYFL